MLFELLNFTTQLAHLIRQPGDRYIVVTAMLAGASLVFIIRFFIIGFVFFMLG